MKKLQLSTENHDQMIDITSLVEGEIPSNHSGIVVIYVPHTSAGVTINEGADPDVQNDILGHLNQSVPWDLPLYDHLEGNSAAHIKSLLTGNNQTVIVEQGKLQLGTWERVFFCEFDGPRTRNLWIKFL